MFFLSVLRLNGKKLVIRIREFDNSRKLYIRGCFHNKRGRIVGITYKKKPLKIGKLLFLERFQAVNTYKPQN